MLVKDDDLICLLHGLGDGFAVQGRHGTQVEDFQIDPLLAQNLGCFQGCVDHCRVGDDAQVSSFPSDARFSNWNDVVFGGNLFLNATVEIFVFKEDARIVVADRCLDQAFGVVRCGGTDYLESGVVPEPHLRIVGGEGTTVAVSAVGSAQGDGRWCAPVVVGLGGRVVGVVE